MDDRAGGAPAVSDPIGRHTSYAMTDSTSPRPSPKRAKLCSIEHANHVATKVAERTGADTAVVRTGNPLQPFRVVLASKASPRRLVSRVLTCNEDQS